MGRPPAESIGQSANKPSKPRYSGNLTYAIRSSGSCRKVGYLSTPLVTNAREERTGVG